MYASIRWKLTIQFSLLLGDLWIFPIILFILMGVEFIWGVWATILVLTGVEALEMLMKGCMRLDDFGQ